jgi:hypothetical protein
MDREMAMQVSISHPTDRPNFSRVDVGELTIWFSYRTPIAFHTDDAGTVVRENDWNNTTGRHLNFVDYGDKKSRISGSDFEARLSALLATWQKVDVAA